VDPRDFLAQARTLARSATPAGHRTAICRAYYAAYHVAFELLLDLGFRRITRGHTGHEAVRQHLTNSGLDPVVHAGAMLRRLQDARVRADYWLRDPYPEDAMTAAFWVEQADAVIRTLDRVAAEPAARARMTAAIQTWQRGAGGRR
jgi:uncharacterized protein (UPF0332 family)